MGILHFLAIHSNLYISYEIVLLIIINLHGRLMLLLTKVGVNTFIFILSLEDLAQIVLTIVYLTHYVFSYLFFIFY